MMSESETLESVDLGGLQPVKPHIITVARRSCRECQFSFMEGGDRVCRFNPPQVTYIAMPGQKMVPTPQGPRPAQVMEIRNFSGFPIVQHEQWCGQFMAKVRNG